MYYKVGIDEAGRGPWAGPVVACAFCFGLGFRKKLDIVRKLKDSKQLSEKKRKKIFGELMILASEKKIYFGVGEASSHEIDKLNIKQANKLAMSRALDELFSRIDVKKVGQILIDGNDNYTFLDIKVKVKFVVKGDTLIDEIKAASIIAKVFRDYVMDCYSLVYPDYGFDLHKGYGTKKHMEALKKYGVVGIHRKSYKPIKNYEVEKF